MENSFNSAFLALKIWIYPNYCISLHSMMKTINTKKVIVFLRSIPFLTLARRWESPFSAPHSTTQRLMSTSINPWWSANLWKILCHNVQVRALEVPLRQWKVSRLYSGGICWRHHRCCRFVQYRWYGEYGWKSDLCNKPSTPYFILWRVCGWPNRRCCHY